MWSSLLETWTPALAPHTPQILILVEWPSHQGCAVVSIRVQILITTYFSIFYFFFQKTIFLISTNQTCFFISKIQDFFLYSQKQVFENRKQKLLLNITLLFFPHKFSFLSTLLGIKVKYILSFYFHFSFFCKPNKGNVSIFFSSLSHSFLIFKHI